MSNYSSAQFAVPSKTIQNDTSKQELLHYWRNNNDRKKYSYQIGF